MTAAVERETWTGQWVADRLGISLTGAPDLPGLLGLAVRDNARRAHLLVSNVLGKHVPQRPEVVHGAGVAPRPPGARAARPGRRRPRGGARLRGDRDRARAQRRRRYRHRALPALDPARGARRRRRPAHFEESHSHATSHLLLPEDPRLLDGDGPLILVDDEFSTGNTVLNTLTALHTRRPRDRYVVVALVDMRTAADRKRLEKYATELGARVDLVALAAGGVRLPDGVLERGLRLVAAHRTPPPAPAAAHDAVRVDLGWPAGLPDGGRHGFTPAHRERLEAALPAMAERVRAALPTGARRVLVLGCEELMYAPLRLAGALGGGSEAREGLDVRFSTTTRSPVLAVDDPGYAIRTRVVFPAHDDPADGPGERYAYNVAPGTDPARRFDAIVAVVDSAADTPRLHAPGGLLTHLAAHTDRLLLAVVPSYVPETAGRNPHAP